MYALYNSSNPCRRVSGLGLVASGPRKILDGTAFKKYFPASVGTDPVVSNNATTMDTVAGCEALVKSSYLQSKMITAWLLSKSTGKEDFLRKLFEFYYKHFQYKEDKRGVEQLRTPARAFHDRVTGIDCDCYSISIACCLACAGIPYAFRIVKMYGNDYYQHIYVVVPKFSGADLRIRRNYWVIDPVLDRFDFEAEKISFITDKKITMNGLNGMPLQILNGTDETISIEHLNGLELGEEFEGKNDGVSGFVNGLGDGIGEEDLGRLRKDLNARWKKHLINTHRFIVNHPHMVKPIYQPEKLAGAYEQLIGAFDNEASREAMLEHLSGNEENLLQPALQGFGNIIHHEDDDVLFHGINGLDLGRTKRKAGKKAGVFTKMKNANAHSKGKGKKFLKKLAKGVLQKYNPAFITIRAGMLAAMKTNTLRIASRVYWGTQSKESALKAGVSASFYDKAVKGYEFLLKTFVKKLGGKESAIKKAIITGRAAKIAKKLAGKGKLTGFDELAGLGEIGSLGVVTAAAVTTAMTFLTTIAGMLKKIMGKKGDSAAEESETGAETESTEASPEAAFTQTDAGSNTAPGDDSAVRYKKEVVEAPENSDTTDDSEDRTALDASPNTISVKKINAGSKAVSESTTDTSDSGEESKGMGTTTKVLISLAAVGVAVGIGVAVKKKPAKKTPELNGLGKVSKAPKAKKAEKAKKVKPVNLK